MKKKQMILLAALLAVLAAGYGILVFQNKKAEREEQAAQESSVIKVIDLGEIQSFSYQTPEREKLHFKKKNNKWICTKDKKANLDQTYPNRIADTFSSLTASRKLEDIDALEDYGLNKPAYIVELSGADGKKITVNIGNLTGKNIICRWRERNRWFTLWLRPMRRLSIIVWRICGRRRAKKNQIRKKQPCEDKVKEFP